MPKLDHLPGPGGKWVCGCPFEKHATAYEADDCSLKEFRRKRTHTNDGTYRPRGFRWWLVPVQRWLGVLDDGLWGPRTERAFLERWPRWLFARRIAACLRPYSSAYAPRERMRD